MKGLRIVGAMLVLGFALNLAQAAGTGRPRAQMGLKQDVSCFEGKALCPGAVPGTAICDPIHPGGDGFARLKVDAQIAYDNGSCLDQQCPGNGLAFNQYVDPSGVRQTSDSGNALFLRRATVWDDNEEGFGGFFARFKLWVIPTPEVGFSSDFFGQLEGREPSGTRLLQLHGPFTRCGVNAQGNCDTTVRFTAVMPDGKPWGKPIDGELWIDKPPPDKGDMQLSVGNMGIVIDPDDPLVVYKVKAVITDRVPKKKMVLERSFTAVEASPNEVAPAGSSGTRSTRGGAGRKDRVGRCSGAG